MLPSQISSVTSERHGAGGIRDCSPVIASLPQRVALALIRAYQLVISPLFAGSCRFVPSCSHYAAEAVTRFGAIRGGWLAVRRLSRCHPFGGEGFDPVPPSPAPATDPGLAECCKTTNL